MSTATLRRRLSVYLATVDVCGIGTLVTALATAGSVRIADVPLVLAMSGLVVLGELFPAVLWRGQRSAEYTFTGTFSLVLVLVAPLWWTAAVQAVAVLIEEFRSRKPWQRVLFNVAQYTLTVVAARVVYATATGRPIQGSTGSFGPSDLPAALLAAGVFFLVNTALIGCVRALAEDLPPVKSTVDYIKSEATVDLTLLATAPLMLVVLDFSLWTLPLTLVPIWAIRRTAQLASEREVRAVHDELTGLPNRALFQERTEQVLAATARANTRAAMLLLDLDHFKEINDTLGHRSGDSVLRVVASRLRPDPSVAEGTVARLGGDEFAVLVPEVADASDAERAAERVANALDEPMDIGDIVVSVRGSVGIALIPEHGKDAETLLRHADVALYRAKRQRAGHALYEADDDPHTPQRLMLAADLHEGLDAGDVSVQYQPKVQARDGRLVGVEALVRWSHPRLGVLQPDTFLDTAENAGMIVPLTMRVLELSLEQVAQWRAEGLEVGVAINVSARQLIDVSLPATVAGALGHFGVDADSLTVEVTETSIMADPERAMQVVLELRNLGVHVAVDDYGTGYSSLSYLRDLAADELKIDKSFVTGLSQSEAKLKLVRSTIELGHSLGLEVTAEGVEDESSAALLRDLGCDVLQGYWVSRPLWGSGVATWLARNPPHRTIVLPDDEPQARGSSAC